MEGFPAAASTDCSGRNFVSTGRDMTESEIEIIQTERFGEIKVPKKEILFFPEGLLGFAEMKRYVFIEETAYAPFLWMQSLEDPHLCFVVVNPLEFLASYQIDVKPVEIQSLELNDLNQARILSIVVVREDPALITANLQGPLIINPATCQGKQVVLLTDRYHTRHYILQEAGQLQSEAPDTRGE